MRLLRFVAFSVIRAWQGFWRNAMMSLAATATVVLMLVLLSGLLIVLGGLQSGLQYIEQKVGVTARLVDNLPKPQIDVLVADIKQLEGVKGVEYVSPQAALERLKEAYREQKQELLAQALKMLNGEMSPHLLYGSTPPGERERDDE